MGLGLQETFYSSQELKPWRSDQETCEEKLFINAQQQSRQKGLLLRFKLETRQKLNISCFCQDLRNKNF